jgi:hypothetical protein
MLVAYYRIPIWLSEQLTKTCLMQLLASDNQTPTVSPIQRERDYWQGWLDWPALGDCVHMAPGSAPGAS